MLGVLRWGVVFGGVGCSSARTETANAKGFDMRIYGLDDKIDGTSDDGVRGDECSRSV